VPEGAITLGLDLGTSAVKVVAADADGRELATGAANFATRSELPDQAEQDPSDWLLAVSAATADLRRQMDARAGGGWAARVAGLGLTGQLPTLVCLAGSRVAGPAITWKDARADGWAATHIDASERRALYARTGMPIDGRYLGPMFAHHWRARAGELTAVLSAKDYLAYVLTGERVTDPSTAAGYGVYEFARGAFSAELAALWELPLALLPEVRAPGAAAGRLNALGARLLQLPEGIPVAVGAADSVCSGYAMAGLAPGRVAITMGSSTVILDALAEPRLDGKVRYLLTPHVAPGWYAREMDLLATGTGYRWLKGLFGWAPGQLDRQAAGSVPGARGLLFAPYLAGGEQGALWDPSLRGTLDGLTTQHQASDIARAFLEGIYFEMRRCVAVLAETQTLCAVVVSGRFVEQTASLALLADILARPIEVCSTRSPAALGAALLARPLAELAPAATAGHDTGAEPGEDAALYDRLYAHYLERAAVFARAG
jgi:xylulokinase